jgi:hypothetical protein
MPSTKTLDEALGKLPRGNQRIVVAHCFDDVRVLTQKTHQQEVKSVGTRVGQQTTIGGVRAEVKGFIERSGHHIILCRVLKKIAHNGAQEEISGWPILSDPDFVDPELWR